MNVAEQYEKIMIEEAPKLAKVEQYLALLKAIPFELDQQDREWRQYWISAYEIALVRLKEEITERFRNVKCTSQKVTEKRACRSDEAQPQTR